LPTTLFFLAGEASGDLHGAKLVAALRERDPALRCIGMGGPRMAEAGMEIAKDLEGMQVMGFWEVARQYGFFKKVFYALLDRVKQERPAALICIDYPGFNLRFASEVRKLGIPCLYYIVPQVWAWKPKRAAKMAEFIDRAYCVFEFEPPFFEKFRSRQRKMKTVFVGHPLLDGGWRIGDGGWGLPPGPKTVGLLTGSREDEFRHLALPLAQGFALANRERGPLRGLMSVPAGNADAHRRVVKACLEQGPGSDGSSSVDGVRRALAGEPAEKALSSVRERTDVSGADDSRGGQGEAGGKCGRPPREDPERPPSFDLADRGIWVGPKEAREGLGSLCERLRDPGLSHAACLPRLCDFSVVKSGTSTLEAGLQGKPMCVVYRGSWASYALARLMVDIPVFSLVNIVLGRYAVPELLQGEVTAARIAREIWRGLEDTGYIDAQKAALAELPGKLGGPGASGRAARGILDFLAGRE